MEDPIGQSALAAQKAVRALLLTADPNADPDYDGDVQAGDGEVQVDSSNSGTGAGPFSF